MDNDAVRGRLKEIRRESGLSQTLFAQRLGIPFRTYQAVESGERGISVETIDALYEQFAVNPLWLMRGVGARSGDTKTIAVDVLRGLLARWSRYPVTLTPDEKVDDFARVLEHAHKLGLSEELMDIAVRRVG